MATRAQQVIPVSQARTDISTILDSFTSSTSSEPVFIGAHRKAEAVLVPVSIWEEILNVFEDIEIGNIIRARSQSKSISFEGEKVSEGLKELLNIN
jgi:PHD/YefM family antitoxin component YafN of YafNO toxin-antitoxin module